MVAVNFNSILSGWLTESMLGKHSTLLGGEVFGINRRYYHCKAVGGCHVGHLRAAQGICKNPSSGLWGCLPPALICLSQEKGPFLHSELTLRVTSANPESSLNP